MVTSGWCEVISYDPFIAEYHQQSGGEALFPGSLGHEFKKVGRCGTGEDVELWGLDFDVDVSGAAGLTIRVRIIECRKSCHHLVVVLVDKSTKFVSSDKHRVVLKRRIR